MKHTTENIKKLIKRNIEEVDPEAEVILYGSRARGDSRNDSDWDVLILTDNPADLKTESKFRDNLYDLELQTGEPFSVFVHSREDWHKRQKATPFYENVEEEGVSL